MAARNFFEARKPSNLFHTFHSEVSGPIIRNKTFFLFTGEKYREGTPAPLFGTVPTPEMKRGDFSGLVDASGDDRRVDQDAQAGVAGIVQQAPDQPVDVHARALDRLQDMALVEHDAAGQVVAAIVALGNPQNLGDRQRRGAGGADRFACVDDAMKHVDSLIWRFLGRRVSM